MFLSQGFPLRVTLGFAEGYLHLHEDRVLHNSLWVAIAPSYSSICWQRLRYVRVAAEHVPQAATLATSSATEAAIRGAALREQAGYESFSDRGCAADTLPDTAILFPFVGGITYQIISDPTASPRDMCNKIVTAQQQPHIISTDPVVRRVCNNRRKQ
mgnify:CR=1 FL=1